MYNNNIEYVQYYFRTYIIINPSDDDYDHNNNMYLSERGDLCDRQNVTSKKIQHIINQYIY